MARTVFLLLGTEGMYQWPYLHTLRALATSQWCVRFPSKGQNSQEEMKWSGEGDFFLVFPNKAVLRGVLSGP